MFKTTICHKTFVQTIGIRELKVEGEGFSTILTH